MPEEMDYVLGEPSFSTTHKETLSSTALSAIRVMAFLDSHYIQNSLFDPLRRLFRSKNSELKFDFPITAAAHKETISELVEASLLHLGKQDKTYAMRLETQTSILADLQTTGLISPLFNVVVKVLAGLWPQMVCIPDRKVANKDYQAALADPNFEAYLKQRYSESLLPPAEEYSQYAGHNIWGRRDELVKHITRMEHIFFHLNDEMVDVCATLPFAMLLTEAAWYYIERSNFSDAKFKIDSALGVYELTRASSSIHRAGIYRVHAAIAYENGRTDDATRFANMQLEHLGIRQTEQGDMLTKSGLLDRNPDMMPHSLGLSVPPGVFLVLPFRSICSFGHKLYWSAQDEKHEKYLQYLHQADVCFTTALTDCKNTDTKTARRNSRMGELYYALGHVANKQASFFGKTLFQSSLRQYEYALQCFQTATANDTDAAAKIAKTHYKLATVFIRTQDVLSALSHLDKATSFYAGDPAYEPHLARVLFQRSRIQTMTRDPAAMPTLHKAFAIRVAVRGGMGPNEIWRAQDLAEWHFDELIAEGER